MAQIKVRYKGIADERVISKKDLAARDIVVDQDLVWNRENLFAVKLDATDALVALLKNEGHFQISEVTDDGAEGAEIITASDPLVEGDTIVDGDTGAKTAGKTKR